MSRTDFLSDEYPFESRLYCIRYQITSCPTCHRNGCHNIVNWKRGKFNPYCSIECSSYDSERLNKSEETCIKKYGVDNPWKSKHIREKIHNTMKEKYGEKYPIKCSEIRKRIYETNMNRYGHENPMQSNSIVQKT